jgi:hypothetical protein
MALIRKQRVTECASLFGRSSAPIAKDLETVLNDVLYGYTLGHVAFCLDMQEYIGSTGKYSDRPTAQKGNSLRSSIVPQRNFLVRNLRSSKC